MRKEKEFRQECCRNSTKIRREKNKKAERERRGISTTEEFRQHCYRNSSAQNPVRPVKKKQLRQRHCRNRKGKKFFFLVIVTMALPKMGKKIEWNYGNVIAENGREKKFFYQNLGRNLKKKMLRSQYFYNTFTTNHMWLVIISSNLILTLRLLF